MAILKYEETVLYLVREIKGTKDFEKLRNAEADKVRCGRKHFEKLDVDFEVVVSANEVKGYGIKTYKSRQRIL